MRQTDSNIPRISLRACIGTCGTSSKISAIASWQQIWQRSHGAVGPVFVFFPVLLGCAVQIVTMLMPPWARLLFRQIWQIIHFARKQIQKYFCIFFWHTKIKQKTSGTSGTSGTVKHVETKRYWDVRLLCDMCSICEVYVGVCVLWMCAYWCTSMHVTKSY